MSKKDKPPCLFSKRLGAFWPANDAAEDVTGTFAQDEIVELRLVKARANRKRLALYWVVMAKAATALNDKCEGDALNSELLHLALKERFGMYGETILPNGQVVKDFDSISLNSMAELERSEFVSRAFATVAKWLGCTVEELTQE